MRLGFLAWHGLGCLLPFLGRVFSTQLFDKSMTSKLEQQLSGCTQVEEVSCCIKFCIRCHGALCADFRVEAVHESEVVAALRVGYGKRPIDLSESGSCYLVRDNMWPHSLVGRRSILLLAAVG